MQYKIIALEIACLIVRGEREEKEREGEWGREGGGERERERERERKRERERGGHPGVLFMLKLFSLVTSTS